MEAKQKNRSQLFYYNKNVEAIIQNIYDLQNNSVDEYAKIVKKCFDDFSYNLNDKLLINFVMKKNLHDAWENIIIPKPAESFLCISI